MTLLLLACAHTHSPALPADHPGASARSVGERIQAALLADDPEAATPWRATVATIGPYQLVPGRDVFAPEPDPIDFTLPVVTDEGAIVRLVDDLGGIRMVVGVRREDLAPRLVEATRLALSPDALTPSSDTFAEIAAGTAVTLDRPVGAAIHVRWSEPGLTTEGWVPATAVGEVWRQAPPDTSGRWADVRLLPLEPGAPAKAPLHARPDFASPILANVEAETTLLLFAQGEPTDGWQRVEAVATGARAVGWLPPGTHARVEGYGVGFGGGSGHPPYTGHTVLLAKGTWIHAERATEPFARATRDVVVPFTRDLGATVAVRIRSRWGDLTAVADCPVRSAPDSRLRCAPAEAPAPAETPTPR